MTIDAHGLVGHGSRSAFTGRTRPMPDAMEGGEMRMHQPRRAKRGEAKNARPPPPRAAAAGPEANAKR
ncbi:hypothetical protein [Solimonas variicoloris]|uniref:hypothetical protein n=1 Tax=Solimonas variicoloris TaxID=254408 RepID=UPI000382DAC4|nr:hypothetical protein [Solimonas variicoloris]